MEVAIPQLHKMGESLVPVLWQPSDAKESIKTNFGRIRYQVRKTVPSSSLVALLSNLGATECRLNLAVDSFHTGRNVVSWFAESSKLW